MMAKDPVKYALLLEHVYILGLPKALQKQAQLSYGANRRG